MLNGTRQRVLVYHVVMASRKPKGIADDIVGGIRNIVSPWLGTPPGQNRSVTQAQGLARSAAETLDQTFAGGMIKAGTQGNKALVKQAGVNAAALATGYIAGKVAGKVGQRFFEDIGLHASKPNIRGEITYTPERANTGFSDVQGSPLIANKTYKISGYYGDKSFKNIPNFGKLADPKDMAGSAQALIDESGKSVYITKSKTGRIDPEFSNYRDRITGNQQILKEIRLRKNASLKSIETFETKIANVVMQERKKITAAQNLNALRAGVTAIPIVNVKQPKRR